MTASDKKIAIVTGGASGIGLAIARKFVQKNIQTIIIGRDKQKLEQACKDLGRLARSYVCDLSNFSELPGLATNIAEEYGQIDILVNNAGIHLKKPLLEVTDDEFFKVIEVNLNAVFVLSRETAKVMARQKSGSILNISSMAARYGIPKVIAYTAAKSAVEGMTKAMAVELSPLGIRVNCLAPGFIETNMSAKALDDDPERMQKVLSRTPMQKLGVPEDIAEAAYFVTSGKAGYLTGVILPVDGGNSIGF